MKHQALFSSKANTEKTKVSSAAILLDSLKVKNLHLEFDIELSELKALLS